MPAISKTLSLKPNRKGEVEILIRLTHSRQRRFRLHSGIYIQAERFDGENIIKNKRMGVEAVELAKKDSLLREIEAALIDFCVSHEAPTKEDFKAIIRRLHNNGEDVSDIGGKHGEFFALWLEFIQDKNIVEHSKKKYLSTVRALHRFRLYKKITLTINGFDASMLAKFIDFYKSEHLLYEKYPQIYKQYPADLRTQRITHKPQPRGDNASVDIIKQIRAFYNWCIKNGVASSNPTLRYRGVKTENYGTPYYLTNEERDKIADYDFSDNPGLERQRDVFIFQCLVGCRVSDMYNLTRANISNDVLQYIPSKTKKERLDTVRVPLSSRAKQILSKYEQLDTILPFISQQRYNDNIKEICRICGIDRVVTIVNPTTGNDERKPIWAVASSHMARRTFIGNIYKRVKDPNLVGALSGHKEGSKAFARYREIDDDMRRELIDFLE